MENDTIISKQRISLETKNAVTAFVVLVGLCILNILIGTISFYAIYPIDGFYGAGMIAGICITSTILILMAISIMEDFLNLDTYDWFIEAMVGYAVWNLISFAWLSFLTSFKSLIFETFEEMLSFWFFADFFIIVTIIVAAITYIAIKDSSVV